MDMVIGEGKVGCELGMGGLSGSGMARVQLGGDEAAYLVEVLERELRRLKRRLARVRRELRRLEERYGMSTEEFLEMYARAERGEKGVWKFPEEADSDAIEWYSLAQLEKSLTSEAEKLKRIVSKMKKLEKQS